MSSKKFPKSERREKRKKLRRVATSGKSVFLVAQLRSKQQHLRLPAQPSKHTRTKSRHKRRNS